MPLLKIDVDVSDLADLLDFKERADEIANEAARGLATMVHGRMLELGKERLHSRREAFEEGLQAPFEEDGVWVISLNAKARWTDDGMEPHNMLEDLLASKKAKTAKDGSRYLTIPFNHSPGQGPTKTTPAQQDLISTIRSALKKEGIPFAKIEKDANGSPKIGRLHSLDIMNRPKKKAEGAGQGHGPVGDVRQGPTGIPFLQGVRIYQNWATDPKTQKANVKRSIFTFRIASSKHRDQGNRWNHPGSQPANIFEDAWKTALEEWEREILPSVLDKILATVS